MDGRRVFHVVSAASLLLLLVATVPANSETSTCRLVDCPNYRAIHYYEELGCVRSDGSSECCPTRFNCSSLLSLDKTKCHYDGKTYERHDSVVGGSKDVCAAPCGCFSDGEGGEASIGCALSQCRGYVVPEGMESICYPAYSLDRCCGTGITCANDTKSPRNVTECTYKGKTYLEGQFIHEADDECKRCVCQEGYDGTLNGPWCRRHSCDYYIWRGISRLRECAPIFYEDVKCCAYDFHCPNDEPSLVRRSGSLTADAGAQCSFGDHRLNIGDELLVGTDGCVKCRCDVPPFITCTQKTNPDCMFRG